MERALASRTPRRVPPFRMEGGGGRERRREDGGREEGRREEEREQSIKYNDVSYCVVCNDAGGRRGSRLGYRVKRVTG